MNFISLRYWKIERNECYCIWFRYCGEEREREGKKIKTFEWLMRETAAYFLMVGPGMP
jgi:hypothetical protein